MLLDSAWKFSENKNNILKIKSLGQLNNFAYFIQLTSLSSTQFPHTFIICFSVEQALLSKTWTESGF